MSAGDPSVEKLREQIETVKRTRTAWLEQHGVPISMEFVHFAEAIGQLCTDAQIVVADRDRLLETFSRISEEIKLTASVLESEILKKLSAELEAAIRAAKGGKGDAETNC